MDLSKYKPINIRWWQLFSAVLIAVTLACILTWITMAVLHETRKPQLTGIEKARHAFVENCSGTRTVSGWTAQSQTLVPNAAGDDASKWKCEAK